jgi:hypothetical protein
MKEILNPFEELLVGLTQAQIDFITVGGMACAMNGYLRATLRNFFRTEILSPLKEPKFPF